LKNLGILLQIFGVIKMSEFEELKKETKELRNEFRELRNEIKELKMLSKN
jgi:archaellum component FlaC